MKGKIITSKGNQDGTVSVKFAKGLDRKMLIDMENQAVELEYSKGEDGKQPQEDTVEYFIRTAMEALTQGLQRANVDAGGWIEEAHTEQCHSGFYPDGTPVQDNDKEE